MNKYMLMVMGGLMGLVVSSGMIGCTDPEPPVPDPKIATVQAYGQTLDEGASPKQVAYVLLQSLADDVRAAQAHEHDKQRQAQIVTWSLAAYETIENRLANTLGGFEGQADKGKRKERVFKVVDLWAPIVAHYIASFDETYEAAAERMTVKEEEGNGANGHAMVYYPVAHDPTATAPAERQPAVIAIEMISVQAENETYWRVARVGFLGPKEQEDKLGAAVTPIE